MATRTAAQTRAQYQHLATTLRDPEADLRWGMDGSARIPPEWHEIAQGRPTTGKVRVTLALEADVVKFFRSLGPGYGPRINDVLKSYVHARLAGVIRGAETLNLYREAAEVHDGPKPAFGATAKAMGEDWADAPAAPPTREARMQQLMELRAARDAAEAKAAAKPE